MFSSTFIASLDDDTECNLWRALRYTGEVTGIANSKLQSRGSLLNFKTGPAATWWSSIRTGAELCVWDKAPQASPQAEKQPLEPQPCWKGPTNITVGAGLNTGCPCTGLPDVFVEASYVVLRGPRWKCVLSYTDFGNETWNSIGEMPLPKYFMW